MGKKYGVRMLIGISMTLSSVITLLMPALAKTSFSLFALSRVLLGLFQVNEIVVSYDAISFT